MMRTFVLLMLSAGSATVSAHEPRQVAAHVHGEALLELAVDGPLMTLRLEAPGIGILDFERPAKTSEEHAALGEALAALKAGTWLTPAARAQCTLQAATSAAHGYGTAASPAVPPGAGQGDHHDHGHAGFIATLQWRCAAPMALTHVDVRLPEQFPVLRQVEVQTITAAGQGSTTVSRGSTRVSLQ